MTETSTVTLTSTDSTIRTRIRELLEVYPKLSPTMIQSGLGPSLSPRIWRPVFDTMVINGEITQDAELPPINKDRTRPYIVVQLTKNIDFADIKVPPPPNSKRRLVNVDVEAA